MEFQQVMINENQFALTTYNGLKVIVNEKDGYYNATNLCGQSEKNFYHYKQSKEWEEVIEVFNEEHENIKSSYVINEGIPNDFKSLRGTYVHPDLIHFVAHWCSIEYAFKVSKIMNAINDRAKLQQMDDNENIEDVLGALQDENDRLATELHNKSVRSSIDSRKLTLYQDEETGRIKMSADNNKKFRDFIIQYEFPASMNIRMELKKGLKIKNISNLTANEYTWVRTWCEMKNPKSILIGNQ